MTKFAAHTMVHDGLTSHSFAPGDELPEWAEGLVGEHVLERQDPADSEDAEGSDESDASDQDQGDDSGEDADGESKDQDPADDQPDFTAPAPARRRGRTQK